MNQVNNNLYVKKHIHQPVYLRYPFVSGPLFLRFKSVFGLFPKGRDKRHTRGLNKLMKSVVMEELIFTSIYNRHGVTLPAHPDHSPLIKGLYSSTKKMELRETLPGVCAIPYHNNLNTKCFRCLSP